LQHFASVYHRDGSISCNCGKVLPNENALRKHVLGIQTIVAPSLAH